MISGDLAKLRYGSAMIDVREKKGSFRDAKDIGAFIILGSYKCDDDATYYWWIMLNDGTVHSIHPLEVVPV